MQLIHDTAARRFLITTDAGDAVLEYEANTTHVIFTHTFVPPPLRGQGIAESLVSAGLSWAKETGRQVTATCSYVVRYLERNPPAAMSPRSNATK